jgi:hypothetical protein
MTRILIFGEGPHDVGRREWSPRTREQEISEGWLQPMVRRLRRSTGSEEGFYLRELITFPGRPPLRPLTGLARKAQLAKLKAISDGFDAVVLATDTDSVDRAAHNRKVEDIETGFATMRGAVVGVACVPMGTSEAWLLADADAWVMLGATGRHELPRRPEQLWGHPHDPASNHPKSVFARVCAANGIADTADTRVSLAETCAREDLERACPTSFPSFARQISEI